MSPSFSLIRIRRRISLRSCAVVSPVGIFGNGNWGFIEDPQINTAYILSKYRANFKTLILKYV